jgi:hypothetical protein
MRQNYKQNQAWRRCYECGRFISNADLPSAKTHDPTSCTDWEPRDPVFIHAKCASPSSSTVDAGGPDV